MEEGEIVDDDCGVGVDTENNIDCSLQLTVRVLLSCAFQFCLIAF